MAEDFRRDQTIEALEAECKKLWELEVELLKKNRLERKGADRKSKTEK